jgi:cytochrome b
MNFTPLILLFPVAAFYLASSGRFRDVVPVVWILSIIICLGWGVYISRTSRFLGWLCVAVALIMIFFMLMPVVARG